MMHKRMPILPLLFLVCGGLLACGGSLKRSHDLNYDVRAYNEGVRWAKLPQAATRILPSEREAFLDEREELEEELRIDDFEIMRLKMVGKGQDYANVQIKWTWHLDRQGIVRSTTSRQKWRRYGSRWIMLREAHVRGYEMPGIKSEPDPESESDEEAESDEVETSMSSSATQKRVAAESHRAAE